MKWAAAYKVWALWNSRQAVRLRVFVGSKSKAIAGFVAPLVSARVAQWVGYPVPLPILAQIIASVIVAAAVYRAPANRKV